MIQNAHLISESIMRRKGRISQQPTREKYIGTTDRIGEDK